MKDLIKALQIFNKYTDSDCIHCDHDELVVCIESCSISEEDRQELEKLSFSTDEEDEESYFRSYRFGSC